MSIYMALFYVDAITILNSFQQTGITRLCIENLHHCEWKSLLTRFRLIYAHAANFGVADIFIYRYTTSTNPLGKLDLVIQFTINSVQPHPVGIANMFMEII